MNESISSIGRTRRGFLRGLAGTLAAAGSGQAFGQGRAGAAPLDHAAILDLAATAEALAVTLYHRALTGATFRVSDDTAEALKVMLEAETHHLELLRSLGAHPLAERFSLPGNLLSDAGVFVDTALHLETVFTEAYLAATHQFAALGQPELAALAAQFGASEAQHLTLLSQLAGLGPDQRTLPAASFARMADAAPALAPFLRGGAGRNSPVLLPSPEELSVALGGHVAVRGQPFTRAGGQEGRRSGERLE